MTAGICSLFRNSASRADLARYQQQIASLDWPENDVRIYCTEGNSTDDTLKILRAWARSDKRIKVIHHELGDHPFESIPDPSRLRALSELLRVTIRRALNDQCKQILWLESDLIWRPDLLRRLMQWELDVIAPWVWVDVGGHGESDYSALAARGEKTRVFYDTWAFHRLNGVQFEQHEPMPEDMRPFEVASAGSCLLMSKDAALHALPTQQNAILEACKHIRDFGYKIYCDPSTVIWHPWPRGT